MRYFAGEVCDAYLVWANIQRGLTIAVFRGRHVVEPTELTDAEAATYGREVLRVGRAIIDALSAKQQRELIPLLRTLLVALDDVAGTDA